MSPLHSQPCYCCRCRLAYLQTQEPSSAHQPIPDPRRVPLDQFPQFVQDWIHSQGYKTPITADVLSREADGWQDSYEHAQADGLTELANFGYQCAQAMRQAVKLLDEARIAAAAAALEAEFIVTKLKAAAFAAPGQRPAL
ncbi:MAG: hypothetical protein KKA73_09055 [Chloroflexi bacterium]|nr:hypothetical protein [Chloroflexota bacterium]MBU1747826.1 hypothetical protein [Chloroflexota bacterium]